MIGLSRLKRAIADVPTGGMQTGYSKVPLKLCDAQRLEVEFNAIIAERDAALAQNAELVAQAERMRSALELAFISVKTCYKQDWAPYSDVVTVEKAIKLSPTQCLREVEAKAGRAGFIAGTDNYFDRHYDKAVSDEVLAAADQYADLIRRGEL